MSNYSHTATLHAMTAVRMEKAQQHDEAAIQWNKAAVQAFTTGDGRTSHFRRKHFEASSKALEANAS